jgi:hypothetical protein
MSETLARVPGQLEAELMDLSSVVPGAAVAAAAAFSLPPGPWRMRVVLVTLVAHVGAHVAWKVFKNM